MSGPARRLALVGDGDLGLHVRPGPGRHRRSTRCSRSSPSGSRSRPWCSPPFAWRRCGRCRRAASSQVAEPARSSPPPTGCRPPASTDDCLEHRLHHRALRRSDAVDCAGALQDAGRRRRLAGRCARVAGLLLLNGVPGGSAAGNALVLGNAVAQSFQIVAMERFAPRYDPRALTFLQMATSCAVSRRSRCRSASSMSRAAAVWGALS